MIHDWKGRVKFVATNSSIYISSTRSFCFGLVKRANAQGVGRFLGMKFDILELISGLVEETEVRDANGLGSMHLFTGIHNTKYRWSCSLHLRWYVAEITRPLARSRTSIQSNRNGLLNLESKSTHVEVGTTASGILLILLQAIDALQ